MEKVSVIIPTYNGAGFIRETVESALAQTYPELEIIVVDDGSKDQTEKILEPYFSSGKIKYIRQENGGVARARNTGITASTGHYISLLDHDDLWMPEKTEKQIKFLDETGAKAVFCNGIGIPAGRPIIKDGIFKAGVEDILEAVLMKGYTLMPSSLLFDKKVIEKTGLMEESIPGSDDWDFAISMARNFKIGFIGEYLYKKREHRGNLTNAVLGRVDYLTVIHKKQKQFFNGAQEKVLRKAMSDKCLTTAKKNMSLQRLGRGLETWAYSVKIKPLTMLKLPGLLVRYLRFKFKKKL